jgi:hypothetical protein
VARLGTLPGALTWQIIVVAERVRDLAGDPPLGPGELDRIEWPDAAVAALDQRCPASTAASCAGRFLSRM